MAETKLRPGDRVVHIRRRETGTYTSRSREAGFAWVQFENGLDPEKVSLHLLERA